MAPKKPPCRRACRGAAGQSRRSLGEGSRHNPLAALSPELCFEVISLLSVCVGGGLGAGLVCSLGREPVSSARVGRQPALEGRHVVVGGEFSGWMMRKHPAGRWGRRRRGIFGGHSAQKQGRPPRRTQRPRLGRQRGSRGRKASREGDVRAYSKALLY